MSRQLAAALAIASAAVLLSSTAAAAASWRAPVAGQVMRGFAYSERQPFARGARRGVAFAAAAGERVIAPCSGPVTFRGTLPRFGPAVSIRCGALVATLLRVRASHAGRARRGAVIGRATGRVRLGARRAGERWGYVDPLALLGDDRPRGSPLGPAPPRSVPGPAPPRSVPVRPAARAPRPGAAPRVPSASAPRVPSASAARVPWPAWVGIGLLGSLLGPWVVSTSRRRSSTSTLRRTSAMRTR